MHKKDITIGYACLECKKAFKKHRYALDSRGNWELVVYEAVCPQCVAVMYETGSAFKAPKASDSKAWAKLRPFFESGGKFDPGCGSPFEEKSVEKIPPAETPRSEFRKPARKRAKKT